MARCKRVRCIETGKVYDSEVQASRDLGVWATHISHVCTGARKTTGKLRFEFVDEVDIIRALQRRLERQQKTEQERV